MKKHFNQVINVGYAIYVVKKVKKEDIMII